MKLKVGKVFFVLIFSFCFLFEIPQPAYHSVPGREDVPNAESDGDKAHCQPR